MSPLLPDQTAVGLSTLAWILGHDKSSTDATSNTTSIHQSETQLSNATTLHAAQGLDAGIPSSPNVVDKAFARTSSASSTEELMTPAIVKNSGIMTPRELDLTPSKETQSLIDQSKTVLTHLQKLREKDSVDLMERDGAFPSFETLVVKLMDKFRTQAEINQTNNKLLSLSYLIQVHNFAKTKSLSKEVAKGKRELFSLGNRTRELETEVDKLKLDVESGKQQASMFQDQLNTTRALLDRVAVEYRQELIRHAQVLQKQQQHLGNLYQSKLSQDLALDAALFMLALYTISHPLVKYPLNFAADSVHNVLPGILVMANHVEPMNLASLAHGRQNYAQYARRTFIRRMARLITFWLVLRKVREVAMGYGLHNRVGDVMQYALFLASGVKNRVVDGVLHITADGTQVPAIEHPESSTLYTHATKLLEDVPVTLKSWVSGTKEEQESVNKDNSNSSEQQIVKKE